MALSESLSSFELPEHVRGLRGDALRDLLGRYDATAVGPGGQELPGGDGGPRLPGDLPLWQLETEADPERVGCRGLRSFTRGLEPI